MQPICYKLSCDGRYYFVKFIVYWVAILLYVYVYL